MSVKRLIDQTIANDILLPGCQTDRLVQRLGETQECELKDQLLQRSAGN